MRTCGSWIGTRRNPHAYHCGGCQHDFFIGLVNADEFFATIKKVDGSKITLNKTKKNDEKKLDDETLTAVEKVKVLIGKGKFDKDTKKFEFVDGKDLEDGLKNEIFSKEVRAQIVTNDDKKITEIRVFQQKKKKE